MTAPEHLRYTKDEEWVAVDGDIGTVGITDYAQDQLGAVVFVELPAVGAALEQGKVLGAVESTKAVSDIFSPVSGEVVEANESLVDAPETVNDDPYGKGWLVKVKLSAPQELDGLLSAADYQALDREE